MLTKMPNTFVAVACSFLMVMGVAAAQREVPPVHVAPPGDTGRRITDEGLVANYFPAKGKARAVLLLGGSEGGLAPPTNGAARALQAEG